MDVSSLLPGTSEMAERMRAFDWERSALGPISSWPVAFASTLSIVVSARFPMAIYWGREGWLFYNDAWSPILGQKHPWALGRAAREVWPEIWEAIAPDFQTVLQDGEAVWHGDELLPMQRFGFTEECYFDYTFNPIRGAAGSVDGVLNIVQETTERVLGERRTRFLRELSTATAAAKSDVEACAQAMRAFKSDPQDFPAVELYLLRSPAERPVLVEHTGPRLPDTSAHWTNALATGQMAVVEGLPAVQGFWPEPIETTLVIPVAGAANEGFSAVLVAGANPRRPLDRDYRRLLDLTASHLATAIATANSYASERKRAETLAELDRAKTAFFSNVSHEFRTPLTLMLGPLEDELREQKRPAIELAYRNSLRLLKLVNTLLEFSRIEAGRLEVSFEPVDLARLTVELASNFRSAVEKAGLQLKIECPPLTSPAHVDPEMWEKIVLNLMSNALKFTFAGEIEVTLREQNEPRVAILSVRDTGTGIPEAELGRVFERFHRIKNAKSRSHEGSGIGLALVQELTRLHGGAVHVQSQVGVGTTFTVEIPLGTAHLPAEKIKSSRQTSPSGVLSAAFLEESMAWLPNGSPNVGSTNTSTPSLSEASPVSAPPGSRILLADDNRDMREYLERLLKSSGYDVTATSDGEAALQLARENPPDLVLSDVMMPRMDGFALLREIRGDQRLRALPVVLLSARAGEEATVEGVEAGADDYLIKPFSARELLARVRTQVELSRHRRQFAFLLEAERRRLYEAMMHAPAQILILRGPQHVIELSNYEHQRANGRNSVENFVGRPIREAQPEIANQGYFEVLDRVYKTGEPFGGKEAKVVVNDFSGQPREIYVNFVYQPTRDAQGAVDGIFVHAVDVTPQVVARLEVERLVEQRTAKLRETIAELESFSYSIAHDLRAPLRSLHGYANVLVSDYAPDLPADAQKFLQRIETAAIRMDKLVQDVLSYSKVVRGELVLEPLNLDKLLREIIETYPMFAPDKAQVTIVGELPEVLGNEAMLTQVFSNLLGNAVKFVAPGVKPQIVVSAENSVSIARIQIRDNGIGIPPAQHEKVFEMFHKLDSGSSGTGIGLAIVKKAIERMGGKIGIVSEPGAGSTFWIELPLPKSRRAIS